MSKKFSVKELDFTFFCLFLLTVPFSVTVSQAFAVLSILSYIAFRLPKFKDFPLVFWILISLYLSIFVSRLWIDMPQKNALISTFSKTECSDFWMAFLLLPASSFTHLQKTKSRTLLKYIGILFLLTGLLSLLFPFRLSTFVMDGFSYFPGRRLPHQIGVLPYIQLPIFLPIGFQNTHLTNGALLALFLPSIFFHLVRLFRIRKNQSGNFTYIKISYLILSFLSLVLLLLNQSRSIWFGLLLSLILFSNLKIRTFFHRKNFFRSIGIFTFLTILTCILYQQNWLFRRSIEQMFTKQTLENQRIWIHKANFDLFLNHPFVGIGAGNYTEYFEKSYIPLLEKKNYLYYEISITPKSHAHHDFLHFLILGGLGSAFFFLLFWFEVTRNLLRQKKKIGNFVGIYAIFIGSMFQCFLLDDETLLPLLAIYAVTQKGKLRTGFKSVFFVLIPLFISIWSLYHLSQTSEEKLFLHRTRDKNNFLSINAQKSINGSYVILPKTDTNSYYFKLEGCLSHSKNFSLKNNPRREPLRLTLEIPFKKKELSFPTRYEIELRERDAFDQDKLFKIHSETVLRVFHGQFSIGINKVDIPIPEIKVEDELKFYDLGIHYYFNNDTKDLTLPILHIHENCD